MGGLLEFSSPIPVDTPLGRGRAIIFESDTTESWWVVILDDTRAFVTFRQSEIRARRSYTYGRGVSNEEMRKIVGSGALPRKTRRATLPRRKNLASSPRKDTARRK